MNCGEHVDTLEAFSYYYILHKYNRPACWDAMTFAYY